MVNVATKTDGVKTDEKRSSTIHYAPLDKTNLLICHVQTHHLAILAHQFTEYVAVLTTATPQVKHRCTTQGRGEHWPTTVIPVEDSKEEVRETVICTCNFICVYQQWS